MNEGKLPVRLSFDRMYPILRARFDASVFAFPAGAADRGRFRAAQGRPTAAGAATSTRANRRLGHASRRRLRERRVARQFEVAPEDPKKDPRDEIAEDHRQVDWPVPCQRLMSGLHKVDDDAAVSRPENAERNLDNSGECGWSRKSRPRPLGHIRRSGLDVPPPGTDP
jgi:hypothetical protein